MVGSVTHLDLRGRAPPLPLQAPLSQPQLGQQQQVEGLTTQRATRSGSRALRSQAAARTAQQQQGPLGRLVQDMPQLTALRGLALPADASTGSIGGGSGLCAGLLSVRLQQLRALGVLVDHCDVSDLQQLQLLPHQLSQLQVQLQVRAFSVRLSACLSACFWASGSVRSVLLCLALLVLASVACCSFPCSRAVWVVPTWVRCTGRAHPALLCPRVTIVTNLLHRAVRFPSASLASSVLLQYCMLPSR